jgi:hypothetical protein
LVKSRFSAPIIRAEIEPSTPAVVTVTVTGVVTLDPTLTDDSVACAAA